MATVQQRALSGSISNVASIITLLLQNIAIVPLLLRYWGAPLYGLWIAITALQALLQTIDTGQHSYLGNEFNLLYFKDRVAMERLLATGLCNIALLGALQLLAVLVLLHGNWLDQLLGLSVNSKERNDVWLALLVHVLGWLLSGSVPGLVVRLTYSVGYYARFNWWAVLQRVLLVGALVVAVRCGAGILMASVAYCGMRVAINVVMLWDMVVILKRMDIKLQRPSFRLAAHTFVRSTLLTITGILDAASTSGLVTLVTILFSAAVLPIFATLRTLANVATQCVNAIMNPLFPEMSRYSVHNEIEKLNEMTAVCWLVAGTIINVGLMSSIVVAAPIYEIWTRGKLPFHEDLFLLLAISIALKTFGAPWYGYLVCTNAIGEQFWVTALRGVLTLGVTYLLAAVDGLRGIGIAMVGAELVASLLVPLYFIHREFQRRGHAVPWRSFGLACVSLLIVSVAFALSAARLVPAGLMLTVGLALIGVLSTAQWRTLLPETRRRLASMVQRGRPKEALATAA